MVIWLFAVAINRFCQIYIFNNFFTKYSQGAKKKFKDAIINILTLIREQTRIVTILDKFDTLTNSITEGLPREIELRQKQYEYYRDLLFSFPKPETASN
jgi:type I restriction enzyme S subunit